MTRTEIIEELRRSAREGGDCYDLGFDAFHEALEFRSNVTKNEILGEATSEHWRTFYLLVAHALEDE